MSGRTSRRSQAAALAADAAPAVPIADVRTRKWTKQLRTVGHLTLWKWVPDQEAPTEALQKGAFKKTKGRKRQPIEVGRMTRSVRQHLDAPLELLNEYPALRHSSRHSSTTSSPAPHTASTVHATKKPLHGPPVPTAPSARPTPAPGNAAQQTVAPLSSAVPPSAAGTDAETSAPPSAAATGQPTAAAALPGVAAASVPSSMPMIPLPPDDAGNMLSAMVSSDEQLEMALDDLPMLDADEDIFSAPFLSASVPMVPSVPAQPAAPAPEPSSNWNSATNSASQSGQEDGNNTADDSNESASDDDDGSANSASASPMPSPSPATSPMPSRSPSP